MRNEIAAKRLCCANYSHKFILNDTKWIFLSCCYYALVRGLFKLTVSSQEKLDRLERNGQLFL
jgi:hypothetical protein